jgi:hypothetical protein
VSAVFEEIAKFERRLGLPERFYLSLLEENDWGFVIKLHSLFEGAATHVLNLRLGSGKLESAIAHLDFSDTRFGKSRLLLDLGILAKDQYMFLRRLSEMRNLLVHQIQNVSFSFEKYIASFDANQLKSFCDQIGYNTRDQIMIKDVTVPRNQFIRENAKLTLWLTASDILGCLLVEEKFVELEAQERELQARELAFARRIDDMYALTPLALRSSQ